MAKRNRGTVLYLAPTGEIIQLDSEDAWILSKHRCRVSAQYFQVVHEDGRTEQAHRVILGLTADQIADHINGNGFDNRRSNLRICTPVLNCINSKKKMRHGSATSRYKYVSWEQYHRKWKARIVYKGKTIFHKRFDNEEEAARAADKVAFEQFKDFAKLNFPEEYGGVKAEANEPQVVYLPPRS